VARTSIYHFLVSAIASAALSFSLAAQAQQQPDFSKVDIKTNKLADNFYTLDGQGGTISVLNGADGVLLVDAQFAPLTDKIVAAVKAVSAKPIRFLVNTHVHGDHTGGNENFAKLGATILGRDQLRWRLAHPSPGANGTVPTPAVPTALPLVSYDGPVTLHVNGEDVRLIPLRSAHTDGDTVVQFVERDIIAAGDVFRSVGYPYADLNNGGSVKGLIEALGTVIGLAGPNTKVVPGHGAVVDRVAVIAHRDLLLAVRDKMSVLVAQGRTLEESIAAKPTAEFDARVPQAAQTAERFVKLLYTELKAGR
jgi:glyoxylase-like metal-dependent hydrolase (beta-lactamase superfamily II)